LPSDGAMIGTRRKIAITNDIWRAMRSPDVRSRIIAIAVVRGPAAPAPQTNRATSMTGSDGASAVARAPAAYSAQPILSTRRRPSRSASTP